MFGTAEISMVFPLQCSSRSAQESHYTGSISTREALWLSGKNETDRAVWSCSLLSLPEEDETARLEEALREGSASFWDDAEMLQRYLRLTGISQSACARALGRSQASVANRLRILRLPEKLREKMRISSLSERHARALLRLESAEDAAAALEYVLRRGLNVAQTEAYIDRLLDKKQQAEDAAPPAFKALLSELDRLRRTIPGIRFEVEDTGRDIILTIKIPGNSGDFS